MMHTPYPHGMKTVATSAMKVCPFGEGESEFGILASL
jgi:hypothetical protein